ncbi:MAG: hypothetical protein FJ144_01310 [Deltaproteobacteria bacterium]|nr:hypothetical protein [Deltaproteobacteria bacterium]
MGPGLPLYEAAWGAAGLVFGLGGARILGGEARHLGGWAGAWLRCAPLVAVLLAYAGARAHPIVHALVLNLVRSPEDGFAAFAGGGLGEAATSGGLRIGGGLVLAVAFLGFVVPRVAGGALSGAHLLDALVPLAGVAIALGRLGCFAAGCCFGVPTGVVWSVRHPPGSEAYWNHVAQGLIPEDGGASLAVHPLPLYLGGAALVASAASLAARRFGSRPGTPALVFAATLSALRLAVEPLRETHFVGAVPGQALLGSAVLAVCVLALAARAARGLRAQREAATPSTASPNGAGPSRPGTPRRWMRRALSPSSYRGSRPSSRQSR